MESTRPPSPRCACCNKTSNLMRCSRCTVQLYCSKEHQVADYSNHKAICRDIARKRIALENDNNEISANSTAAELYTNQLALFCEDLGLSTDTLTYLRKRRVYAEALGSVNTYDGVKAELEECRAILALDRYDSQGLRDMMPTMMLRVAEDQECYAFVKRCCIAQMDDDHPNFLTRQMGEPLDMDIPADPFYPDIIFIVDRFTERPNLCALTHVTSLVLLKIRMVLDLKALQVTAALAQFQKLPNEVFDVIRSFVPCSNIIANDRALLEQRDYSKEIAQLEAQLSKLYRLTKKVNRHFWDILIKPGNDFTEIPSIWSYGNPGEVHLILRNSYTLWLESPGAIDFVKAKVASGEWH